MLLIGSQALKFYGQEYLCPEVKRTWDTDFIATYDEFKNFKNSLSGNKKIIPLNRGKSIALMVKGSLPYEFEIAWENSTGELLCKLVKENNLAKLVDDKNDIWAANPDVVFTLKKSHRFLRNSPHFLKTMRDYKWLRDQCGCKVPEVLEKEFIKTREKDTYWYRHPKLDVTKDEFFNDDGVKYQWDHDSIHISVSNIVIDGLKTPAYTLYKDDQSEVKCDKNKFNALPELYKLYGVLEEAYVLAIERSQVPFPGTWTPYKSFTFALDKVCSSITSGWFREFAWENYDKVIKLYDDNYVNKFWNDVKMGLVKPFTGKKY
jgi:hypothetical protein